MGYRSIIDSLKKLLIFNGLCDIINSPINKNLTKECSCMKKLNTFLNGVMAAFLGTFIGCGIYEVWKFKTHPELYAPQSAPWYTNILFYGVITLIALLVCIVIKSIIKRKN